MNKRRTVLNVVFITLRLFGLITDVELCSDAVTTGITLEIHSMVRLAAGESDQDDGDHERKHRGLQPFRFSEDQDEVRDFVFHFHGYSALRRWFGFGVDLEPSPQPEHRGHG